MSTEINTTEGRNLYADIENLGPWYQDCHSVDSREGDICDCSSLDVAALIAAMHRDYPALLDAWDQLAIKKLAEETLVAEIENLRKDAIILRADVLYWQKWGHIHE